MFSCFRRFLAALFLSDLMIFSDHVYMCRNHPIDDLYGMFSRNKRLVTAVEQLMGEPGEFGCKNNSNGQWLYQSRTDNPWDVRELDNINQRGPPSTG